MNAPLTVLRKEQETRIITLEEAEAGLFTTVTIYGTAGQRLLSSQSKPMTWTAALRSVSKKVQFLQQRGYEIVPPVSSTEFGSTVSIRAQLLQPRPESEAIVLCRDDDWVAQEKLTGTRVLLDLVYGGAVRALDRHGAETVCPSAVLRAASELALRPTWVDGRPSRVVLDGELVGGKYRAFDILWLGGDTRKLPYLHRLARLRALLGEDGGDVSLVPTAVTALAKTELAMRLVREAREGIVFKRKDAPYTQGRGPDQVKIKFWKTCSCVVLSVPASLPPRHLELGLWDDGTMRRVGRVELPAWAQTPIPDDVVEVRYARALSNFILTKTEFLGIRHDVAPGACTIKQLSLSL